jgi:hypothetical protein
VFGLVGQMRAAVLHLRNPRILIDGILHPVGVRTVSMKVTLVLDTHI